MADLKVILKLQVNTLSLDLYIKNDVQYYKANVGSIYLMKMDLKKTKHMMRGVI